jgi:hypothetical protein
MQKNAGWEKNKRQLNGIEKINVRTINNKKITQ